MATSRPPHVRSARFGTLISWLLFGVAFSALPFAFPAINFVGVPGRPPFHRYYLWQHGELLLVATAFAADATGNAFSLADRMATRRTVLGGCCTLLVAGSAYCYALFQVADRRYSPLAIDAVSLSLCLSTFTCAAVCKSLSE